LVIFLSLKQLHRQEVPERRSESDVHKSSKMSLRRVAAQFKH